MPTRFSVAAVLAAALLAACTANIEIQTVPTGKATAEPDPSEVPTALATATAKPTPTPVVSPTPTPAASPTATPAPQASPTDTPVSDATDTPWPTPTPTATPAGPVVAVSAPPIPFPYKEAGVTWTYSLDQKLAVFDVSGTVTVGVQSLTDSAATIATSLAITKFPLGTPPSPSTTLGLVRSDTPNPYTTGVMFGGAGGLTSTDTVTAATSETLTLQANGSSVPCTKYTIDEMAGDTHSTITLWTAQDGSMVREVFTSDKPLPIVSIPSTFAAFIKGKSITTLELTSWSR